MSNLLIIEVLDWLYAIFYVKSLYTNVEELARGVSFVIFAYF